VQQNSYRRSITGLSSPKLSAHYIRYSGIAGRCIDACFQGLRFLSGQYSHLNEILSLLSQYFPKCVVHKNHCPFYYLFHLIIYKNVEFVI